MIDIRMDPLSIGILIVAGVLIGTISSMIGVGGGIMMVPLLSFFFVPETQQAVGTSLATVVVTGIVSSINYGKKKVIDYKLAFMLMPTVIVGAVLGAWLTDFISSEGLALAFGVLLMYPALMMISGREPKEVVNIFKNSSRVEEKTEPKNQTYNPIRIVLIGTIAGVASGFFGVGSGILMVPAMAIFLNVDMLYAVATSLFVMVPSAFVASFKHWESANIIFQFMGLLAIGIIVGAQIGTRLAMKIPRKQLRQAFGVVLAFSGLNMIWKGVSNLL